MSRWCCRRLGEQVSETSFDRITCATTTDTKRVAEDIYYKLNLGIFRFTRTRWTLPRFLLFSQTFLMSEVEVYVLDLH